jgi:predicted O-linked N-acetylglucosamine transferase (SPINDLY family)
MMEQELAIYQARLRQMLDSGQAIAAFLEIRDKLAHDVRGASELIGFYRESVWRAVSQSVSQCDWTVYELLGRALHACLADDPGYWIVGETTLAFARLNRHDLLTVNRRFCDRFAAAAQASGFAHRAPNGPIRIGVIGKDFYNQATAYLFTGVAEAMDRSRFHLTAYDYGETSDDGDWRRRCIAAYDRFVAIAGMSDREAAERIHTDGIDVLLHMRDVPEGRLGICAYRPAAIQIQYLYFPGTSGADFMDYLVADDIVVPPQLEDGYTETILRLPRCYQPNDSRRAPPAALTRADFGIEDDRIVMANFGQTYKYSPDMFGLWCELLRADPRRLLWLLDGGEVVRANLLREAVLRGVDPAAIVFSPAQETGVHLARLACADLVLDTYPYGGHTLTSDALWAGTPMVSLMGETYASRVPASLLAACGVPELAVHSYRDYAVLADRLLRDPAALAEKRHTIAAAREQGMLFDSDAYARMFGEAIERVVARRWGDPIGQQLGLFGDPAEAP